MIGAIDPTVTAAAIASIGSLIAVVLSSFLSHKNQRAAAAESTRQAVKISEIHVLVNSKMDAALRRIAALEAKLGLEPGETIPAPAIASQPTKEAQ